MNSLSAPDANIGIKPWSQSSRFSPLYQTTDRQTVESFMLRFKSQSESNAQVTIGDNVDLDVRAFEFADLQISAVRYGTEVTARFHADALGVCRPWMFVYNLGGHSLGRLRNVRSNPGDATVFQIEGQTDYLLSPNFEALALVVSDKDLSQAHRALYGNDISPAFALNLSASAGSPSAITLLRAITRLSETPRYPHQAAGRLERGIKESALLEILMNWPGAYVPIPQENILPASTRLARDFIHAHISDLPTVSDVAASCRIGVRALDRGFKKHLGVSPLQYMLDLRLQGVHDDLIACRNGNTVTDVAVYWGFSNLGGFAARFRERFGELPSETLRQSRHLHQRLN